MPPVLLDAVAVAALVALLAVAFTHPPGWVEAGAGLVAAAVVVGVGAVGPHAALDQARLLLPVVGFLAGILVVAELCAVEGVFAAVGALVGRPSVGRPQRFLVLTFAAAAVITAVLSLDATVVLLTPVVAAAAWHSKVDDRPAVTSCVRLANSASLLFPVSNLTNLLALPFAPVSFLRFAALMAPVWLVVIGVEYAGVRLFYTRRLSADRSAGVEEAGLAEVGWTPQPLPVVPVSVVAAMLVGFAVASHFGVAPAWVAAAAAVVLAAYAVSRRRTTPRAVLAAAHLPFAVFVLCLGVVVAALTDTFLGTLVAHVLPSGTSLWALLGLAVVATVLANVVNNLPATLLLVPLAAPLGVTAVLAALVGLNVGSGLTYTGSLANLLWRRTLSGRNHKVSAWQFHRLAAVVTPPGVFLGVLVVWAWSGVIT
ncbi:MAG TPA: SLC13 family permease [Nocardioidaceae bacterium]|nr:SLC13 family permease [Nocardioidaceae bacterium]